MSGNHASKAGGSGRATCEMARHLLPRIMPTTIDLQQMSTPDKLRLMEALWTDLSKGDVVSPAWHGTVLAERERLIDSGEEEFLDWETAKRQLREEVK